MDKRYQVFISSTFRDLQDERQAVLRAVLELDHMPAGMELFPAGDDEAWQLIKDVIDGSDYYVLIIGGRYGSLDGAGIGFTEKEYDYAIAARKPVIPLLHRNPDNLPRERTETDPTAWRRLKDFRAKVEAKHTCVYWEQADDLKARVIVGLTSATKRHPGVGWVRADSVPSEATLADVLALRNRVAELEAQAAADRTGPPPGTEDLEQGEDEFEVKVAFDARAPETFQVTAYTGTALISWQDIFASIAPTLINEATDSDLRSAFRRCFKDRSLSVFSRERKLKGLELRNFQFRDADIDTCIVQLRALGLIRESQRARSVRDTETYWCLTSYGDYQMTRLRALRREPEPPGGKSDETAEDRAEPPAGN